MTITHIADPISGAGFGERLFDAAAQQFARFLTERPETWTVALIGVTFTDTKHHDHIDTAPTGVAWLANHTGAWPMRPHLLPAIQDPLDALTQARAAEENYFVNTMLFRYFRANAAQTEDIDVSIRAFYEDNPVGLFHDHTEMALLLTNTATVPGTVFA